MSRPKPEILLAHTDQDTYKKEEVLKAEAIWAVFYEGQPINLRNSNSLVDYPGPKYRKVSFSNPAMHITWQRNLTRNSAQINFKFIN